MSLLDSDIGYQIGLLAGGLWAERYRERGEEKANQSEPFYNEELTHQMAQNYLQNNSPAYNAFVSNAFSPNIGQTSAVRPYRPYNQNR